MSPKIINTVVILILLVLSLAILANSMTKPLGRDEQVYCTAGVLLARGGMIYRDFSYPAQMPCHPLLYAALFRLSNTTHYLLAGRILSTFCDILVAVCIVGIYRRIFSHFPSPGKLLGLAAATLYVFNPVVDYANGFAWNNDVVILCVVVCLWLFLSVDFKSKSRYRRIALIGALLGFASCMRITIAPVQMLFFVMLLIRPADSVKQRLKNALPFLTAAVVVLLWPAWTIALAPRAFLLNLFRIPLLNSQWLARIGLVHNKFDLVLRCVTEPGYFALVVMAIYLLLILAWRRRKITISNKANALFAPLLGLVFFIVAFMMPTMWKQHLAMPVPFLVIGAAYPLLYLRKLDHTTDGKNFNIACMLVYACLVVAVSWYPVPLHRIPRLLSPQSWTAVRLHRISEDIAEKLKTPNHVLSVVEGSKLILTLAPLYALEGGCEIYPQLSSGPFVYRVADYLSASELDITNAAGPKTLEKLLEKSPPSAVILGVEPRFVEESLFKAAVRPGWHRVTYKNGPVVYFRP